jgi:hypothetical protein
MVLPEGQMSNLFKLKKWMTPSEAAVRLSSTFGEKVHEQDIYRLALDGHLILSVLFVNRVISRSCRAVTSEEIDWIDVPSLDGVKVVRVPAKGRVLKLVSGLYFIEDGHFHLDGVWDLPLIGGERLDVEFEYQQITGGPEVTGVSLEGVFVRSERGNLFEIQEHPPALRKERTQKKVGWWLTKAGRTKAASENSPKWRALEGGANTHPAGSLPEDCLFVVRTEALLQFEQSTLDVPAVEEKPLQTRERRSLLVVLAALAKEAKIDLDHPSKAATIIESLTQQMGAHVAKRTIEEHLKKIPDALEARTR